MTVGAQLQQMRRELKLSLTDVTDKTKIQPWVLEALEGDRLPQMMSPIYVRGFLTTYAKFLRLEPESLIAQVQWPQAASTQETLPPPAMHVAVDLSWIVPWLPRIATALAVSLAVAGIIALHPLQRIAKYTTPVTAKRAKPHGVARATPPPPLIQGSGGASPAAPAEASITGVKEFAPIKPVDLSQLALAPPGPMELIVSAHRTTWMRVRADGKLLTQQRLAGGAQEHWRAAREFEVIIAKPMQVEMTLNGQPITPLVIAHQGRVLITHRGITQLPED